MYILLLDALVNLPVWRRRGFLSELLNIEEGAASLVSSGESLLHLQKVKLCTDHLHLVVMSRAVWSRGCHGTCLLLKMAVWMHFQGYWALEYRPSVGSDTGQLECGQSWVFTSNAETGIDTSLLKKQTAKTSLSSSCLVKAGLTGWLEGFLSFL